MGDFLNTLAKLNQVFNNQTVPQQIQQQQVIPIQQHQQVQPIQHMLPVQRQYNKPYYNKTQQLIRKENKNLNDIQDNLSEIKQMIIKLDEKMNQQELAPIYKILDKIVDKLLYLQNAIDKITSPPIEQKQILVTEQLNEKSTKKSTKKSTINN